MHRIERLAHKNKENEGQMHKDTSNNTKYTKLLHIYTITYTKMTMEIY